MSSIDQSQQGNPLTYNPESCDAILDTAKMVYNEESDRFKQVEAKTNITLAFVGVLFGAFLTYLNSNPLNIKEIKYLAYVILFRISILICFSISIFYFFRSIKVGEFHRVGLNNIIDADFAGQEEGRVKLEISATYKEAIDLNSDKIELKMKHYSYGLNFVSLGFLIFLIHFVIEEISRYVK